MTNLISIFATLQLRAIGIADSVFAIPPRREKQSRKQKKAIRSHFKLLVQLAKTGIERSQTFVLSGLPRRATPRRGTPRNDIPNFRDGFASNGIPYITS